MMILFTVPLWLGALIWIVQAVSARREAEFVAHRMAQAVKVCPDCAETIKRAAKVCRHCGHRQPPMLVAGRPWTPARTESVSIARPMCWVAVCVATAFMVLVTVGMVHKAHADTSAPAPTWYIEHAHGAACVSATGYFDDLRRTLNLIDRVETPADLKRMLVQSKMHVVETTSPSGNIVILDVGPAQDHAKLVFYRSLELCREVVGKLANTDIEPKPVAAPAPAPGVPTQAMKDRVADMQRSARLYGLCHASTTAQMMSEWGWSRWTDRDCVASVEATSYGGYPGPLPEPQNYKPAARDWTR